MRGFVDYDIVFLINTICKINLHHCKSARYSIPIRFNFLIFFENYFINFGYNLFLLFLLYILSFTIFTVRIFKSVRDDFFHSFIQQNKSHWWFLWRFGDYNENQNFNFSSCNIVQYPVSLTKKGRNVFPGRKIGKTIIHHVNNP